MSQVISAMRIRVPKKFEKRHEKIINKLQMVADTIELHITNLDKIGAQNGARYLRHMVKSCKKARKQLCIASTPEMYHKAADVIPSPNDSGLAEQMDEACIVLGLNKSTFPKLKTLEILDALWSDVQQLADNWGRDHELSVKVKVEHAASEIQQKQTKESSK